MSTLGNLPRTQHTLRVAARRSYAFGVKFRRRSDSFPINLTDCTVELHVKQPDYRGGAEIGSGWVAEVIGNPILGCVQFELQSADLDIPAEEYEYAVTLQSSLGYSTLIMWGTLEVVDNADPSVVGVYPSISPSTNLAAYIENGEQVSVYVDKLDGMSMVLNDILLQGQSYVTDAQAAAATAAAAAAEAEAAIAGLDIGLDFDALADAIVGLGLVSVNAVGAELQITTTATQNDTDANLKNRANHTGQQPASSISDFVEATEDAVAAMIGRSTNTGISWVYTDNGAGLGTLAATVSGVGGLDAETARDTVNAQFVGTAGINIAVNDGADTVTFSISGVTIAQVTGLQAALDARVVTAITNVTSAATPTPAVGGVGRTVYQISAQAAAAAFANPTGTATDPAQLIIGIKDNGTARALTWGTAYRAIGGGPPLPSTTVLGEMLWLTFYSNVVDGKWDLVSSSNTRHTHAVGDLPMASNAEAQAGALTTKLITPASLAAALVPTLNAQSGTTYTPVLSDGVNAMVLLTNAAAIAVTIPLNSSVAYPVGTTLQLVQGGAGAITVAGAGGVTLSGVLSTFGPGQELWVTKTATDTWLVGLKGTTPVENVRTVATSGSTQTIPDPAAGIATHRITLSANCTFTFPTAGAGKSFTLVLVQDGTGSRTATWPATVKWPGGTTPTLTTTAAKRDIFTFLCTDGTNWDGFTAGLNFP